MPSGVYYRSPEMIECLRIRAITIPKVKKHTPETIEKMRLAKTGKRRVFTPEWIENLRIASIKAGCRPPSGLGRKLTEEQRKRQSDRTRGIPNFNTRGNKNPNWRGGKSPLRSILRGIVDYHNWRTKVFERDGFQCVLGGKDHGNKLNADHYPKTFAQIIHENDLQNVEEALLCKELWDVDNGRTLCVECHKKTPTYLNRRKVGIDTQISELL